MNIFDKLRAVLSPEVPVPPPADRNFSSAVLVLLLGKSGLVPVGIGAGNGPAFPTTFALCCAILLLFAVGFCAMSRHVPNAGAFYTYIAHGFGRHAGLGARRPRFLARRKTGRLPARPQIFRGENEIIARS